MKNFIRLANICLYIAKGYGNLSKKRIREAVINQLNILLSDKYGT